MRGYTEILKWLKKWVGYRKIKMVIDNDEFECVSSRETARNKREKEPKKGGYRKHGCNQLISIRKGGAL